MSSAIGIIQGYHGALAMMRREPHWLINDDDAKRYGQALTNAARHFSLKTTQKAIDVSALIIVAFQMDAPRFVLSLKQARPPPAAPRGPAQVFQFRPPAAQPPASTTPAGAPDGGGIVAEGPIDFGENGVGPA